MATEPKEYEFHPPGPNDIRSPCPALNSLANHGLLNRDGRNITRDQLKHALQYIGAGTDVAILLVRSAFTIHTDDPNDKTPGTAKAGLRDSTDVTAAGVEVLHLNRVGRPHATEHDVSITRQDRFLGDPVALNPELYKRFLASPRAGPAFRISDVGRYRKTRYDESKRDNPQLAFERKNHYVACAEVAAVQCIFGTGVFAGVPLRYVEALFGEERLPFREGWTPRRWKAYLPELLVMLLAFSHYAWPF